jgi:hypothetical protein
MAIFKRRERSRDKCDQCGDHTLVDPKMKGDYFADGVLRDITRVSCDSCGKQFCVKCMERLGARPNGQIACLKCSAHIENDLPPLLLGLEFLLRRTHKLKAAQGEALGWLTREPLGKATCAIRDFISDAAFVDLVDKIRTIDPAVAHYLEVAFARTAT